MGHSTDDHDSDVITWTHVYYIKVATIIFHGSVKALPLHAAQNAVLTWWPKWKKDTEKTVKKKQTIFLRIMDYSRKSRISFFPDFLKIQ